MARKLITSVLSDEQLKKLRAKSFPERNKIIQDKLDEKQKIRLQKIKKENKTRKDFIF